MRSSPRGQTLERPGPHTQTPPFGPFSPGSCHRGHSQGRSPVSLYLGEALARSANTCSVKAPGQASVSFLPGIPSGCLPPGVTFSCLSFLAVPVSFIHPFLIPPRNSHSALPRESAVFKSTGPSRVHIPAETQISTEALGGFRQIILLFWALYSSIL